MSILGLAGESIAEAFFMFWTTLWALVLGFGLSGAVQAFVSRGQMERALGNHGPRAVARGSLFGMVSSSCSYAASALAKTLFQRGADFTTSMVFMFASTNLVIEVGILLWLLMGWQFALAEFVGGAIMIVIFVLVAPLVFPASAIADARAGVQSVNAEAHHHEHVTVEQAQRTRLRSRAGWAAAASYAIADLRMIRKELVIGYLVAGILATAIPASVYSAIFVPGHGLLTDLENAVVAPLIAVVSFVCSVGNVPLAASLFAGGLSFGGTVSFIFADLITIPLLLIYAKFYGRKLALRLFFCFWLVMSAAGLAVDLLFRLVRIPLPARPKSIVHLGFTWDYTTWLNIVFLAVAAVLYWLYRNRRRFDAEEKYATDPVCGMQVERANAAATLEHDGTTYYFCSDGCRNHYASSVH